jgi:sulfatase maturation enzyme AslB (radical SAM superfamily)
LDKQDSKRKRGVMIFASLAKLVTHDEFHRYMRGETVPIINVEVSPSSVCNAGCKKCLYKGDKNKKDRFIDTQKIGRFLIEGSYSGLKAVTWTGGGEPTLHPSFSFIVEAINIQGKIKQGLFTNALAKIEYKPSVLLWIRITKTNLPFPVENIKILSDQCETVGICINYGGVPKQIDEIKQALSIAHKYNLAYVQVRPLMNTLGKTTRISPPDITDSKLIIDEEKFWECSHADRGYTKCEAYHFSPTVWENGQMDVCGYMRHNKAYKIGNIYTDSFMELIAKMPKSLPVLSDCMICCKNNETNRFISDMRNIECKDFV